MTSINYNDNDFNNDFWKAISMMLTWSLVLFIFGIIIAILST